MHAFMQNFANWAEQILKELIAKKHMYAKLLL